MKLSYTSQELSNYLIKQLTNVFPDKFDYAKDELISSIDKTFEKIDYCFSRINNKYFFNGNEALFNHLNSDQYAMFLYLLANTIWEESNDDIIASKVYYLNKILHGVDVFYEVKLPRIFLFVHCVGTVLGRANYSDYLVVYQRVTIGGSNRLYPELKEGVVLYGESAVIGNSRVGTNCHISYSTKIINKNIPPNALVYGNHPDLIYKSSQKTVKERFFLP